jgi:hypothetical protein
MRAIDCSTVDYVNEVGEFDHELTDYIDEVIDLVHQIA